MLKPARKKKCRQCGERFEPFQSMQVTCSPICALAEAKANPAHRKRLERVKAKAERVERAERKARLKTRREWMKDAQREFNSYIRARAIRFGHTCISSGRPLSAEGVGGGFDCGHFRPTGSAPHLRFNLNNAWGQSKHDNQFRSGAVAEYRIGLIARIGLEKVEALENNNEIRKFDTEYLVRITKIFRRKTRMMERRIKSAASV